jgi:hypothetical protein
MTPKDTIRRMAEANPVPDAGHLHSDPVEAERLFSSIERRRDLMIGTHTRPTPTRPPAPLRQPWYRRPAVVFSMAVAIVLVAAVPLVIFSGGGSDVAGTPATAPLAVITAPPATTPAPTTQPAVTQPATTLPSETAEVPGSYLWTRVELDTGQFTEGSEIRGVTHTGSHFAAVGRASSDCAQIWVSPEGATWDGAPAAGGGVSVPCRAVIHDVSSDGSVSVAVGEKDGRPAVWVSEDAYDWDLLESSMPHSEPRLGEGGEALPVEIRSIVGSEKGFVAAGSAFWFSSDGRTWSESTAPPVDAIVDVTAGPDGFLAVGYLPKTVAIFGQQWSSANAVLHSPAGRTWSVVAELDGMFKAGAECWVAGNTVTHGPHGYVIAGDCTSEEAEIAYSSLWTSSDGMLWSQVPYDEAVFGEPAYITSITADEAGYLAAGWSLGGAADHATVWTSEDGISWIRSELGGTGDTGITSVATHEGTAVVVGVSHSEPAIWLGTRT